ncbi:MAG: heavy metal translocating P-type ATPase, partial [Pedobacter sp.]
MKHTYQISGMSCKGCSKKVAFALNGIEGISAEVTLMPPEAIVTMEKHVPIETLQQALSAAGDYKILMPGDHQIDKTHDHNAASIKVDLAAADQKGKTANLGSGKYYCPMHCQGEKTYDKPGDCPVCGMDLVQQPVLKQTTQYSCPMHPEIIRDQPGACPICGMDLVQIAGNESSPEDDQTYDRLLRKFKIAALFTVPIFLISMTEMIPGNPIFKLMELKYWNWVQFALSIPVVFYATWMFFERAWRSVVTWNLNMFTLIGIGAGVAWLFSLLALLSPGIFPDQFKTHSGTVYV